jgi:SNF2 family DNA or RNA helicase
MTQHVLSLDEFHDVAESVVVWARDTLRELDTVTTAREQARQAVKEVLKGRVHLLEQPNGAASSVLAGCTAVRLPAHSSPHVWSALHNHVAWHEQADPLLQHREVLRPALEEALGRVSLTPRRGLFRRNRRAPSVQAVDRLRELADWADKTGYSQALRSLASQGPTLHQPDDGPGPARALALALGLPEPRREGPALPGDELTALQRVLSRGGDLLQTRERLVADVKSTFAKVRERMIIRRLQQLPLSAIKEASGGQARITALENAGVNTVQQVLDRGDSIASLPGIGQQTATLVVATARSLKRAVKDDLKLRIDLDESDALLTSLVSSLHVLLDFESRVEKHREELDGLVTLLSPLAGLPQGSNDVVLLHRHSPRRGADVTRHLLERSAWVRESGLNALLGEQALTKSRGTEVWEDFKRRAAEYYGLLGEIVGITVDVEAAQGHLPKEVVEAVHEQDLDTTRLKTSLRGYQAFGARYALVQRRVIIGDEMGLGKTLQALAAMAHLAANGARHFLVVCPTAVLVNWTKEIRKHSHLEPVRVHGPGRDREWVRWRSRGGVAVTSYDTLRRLTIHDGDVDLLVVDEAHFVKNPATQRARAVTEYIERSGRATFLTGTPLENKVEEFHNLVSYLQPNVAERLNAAEMVLGAHKFRAAVAPVYLRRNSDDVLSELPDLVEAEEWLEFTDPERDAYVDALGDHSFQEMRRVAFTADQARSSKLERLEEIVEEAEANDLKVVIFSYFRDVLEVVAARLGKRVVGTITGSTSADGRQALADRFTDASKPCVLLSQIVAGGVGMNLQAASVVVLCEPQVKPALENQAVKRAHRMGQVRSVQVHRLLTENSVDERMLEILAQKSEVFAQYAAQSDVAAASPEAVDITEAKVAKQVLAQEQERYAAELRARQGVDGKPSPSSHGDVADTPPASRRVDETTRSEHRSISIRGPVSTPTPERKSGPGSRANAVADPAAARPERRNDDKRPAVFNCGACNRPYDINGHCGCS